MIQIFRGECIYIEKKDFDRNTILQKYQGKEKHESVKFVISDSSKIIAIMDYRDILLKRQFINNTIEGQERVFDEARKYFGKLNNLYTGTCLGVLNKKGNLEYILEYWNNTNFIEEKRQKHFFAFKNYDYKIDYNDEKIHALLSYAHNIIFEYLEEYTVHIINIFLALNREKYQFNLYTLDKKVKKIFKNNEVIQIEDLSGFSNDIKKIIIISGKYSDSEYRNGRNIRCYKSLEIMSLFYEKSIQKELRIKTEKKFMIIGSGFKSSGLVDIMKASIPNCIWADKLGYIPVVNVDMNTVYRVSPRENMWDYYFEPVNEYCLDQVYASKNYVVVARTIEEVTEPEERERVKISKITSVNATRMVKWKKEILDYCKSELLPEFTQQKKILGVIARGTDYLQDALIARNRYNPNANADINKMIMLTKKEMENTKYDYIYLATEDENNYSRYIQEFGDLIITTEQERFNIKENTEDSRKLIASYSKIKDGFEYGLDYLVVLYSLAQCSALVTSRAGGAYIAATALNNGQYKKVIIGNKIKYK